MIPWSVRTGGKTTGSLEQAWRPLIAVESFTKEPEIPKPQPFLPVVGIRWGKPATFEFALNDQKKFGSGLIIREAPRRYFENSIVDFSEQYRQFRTGEVSIQLVDPEENPEWQSYLDSISSIVLADTNPEIELEETTHWISDSGYSYDVYRHVYSNGKIIDSYVVKKVNVFYKFVMEKYIPFKLDPVPKIDERGDEPE